LNVALCSVLALVKYDYSLVLECNIVLCISTG